MNEFMTVPLSSDHDVSTFTCRSDRVARFLKYQAAECQRRRVCRVFVLPVAENPRQIAGYYTLASASMSAAMMNAKHQQELPPTIPMAYMGFMGRHYDAAKGVGRAMLHDAALRVAHARESMDAWGICAIAENEGVAAWAAGLGFERAGDAAAPRSIYAPLETLLMALEVIPAHFKAAA